MQTICIWRNKEMLFKVYKIFRWEVSGSGPPYSTTQYFKRQRKGQFCPFKNRKKVSIFEGLRKKGLICAINIVSNMFLTGYINKLYTILFLRVTFLVGVSIPLTFKEDSKNIPKIYRNKNINAGYCAKKFFCKKYLGPRKRSKELWPKVHIAHYIS